MSNEPHNRREYLAQLDAVLAERAKVLAELAGLDAEGDSKRHTGASEVVPANGPLDEKLARLPLGEAVIEYLASSKTPQSLKEIATALRAAGREFESNEPTRAVKDALKKAMVKNDDIFQVRWARWHLRSKTSKAKLEKYQAENARFGTGGRTSAQHAKRTREGMKAIIERGGKLGAPTIMTAERIATAKRMLTDGMSTAEVASQFGVSKSLIYFLFKIERSGGKKTVFVRNEQLNGENTEPKLRVVK